MASGTSSPHSQWKQQAMIEARTTRSGIAQGSCSSNTPGHRRPLRQLSVALCTVLLATVPLVGCSSGDGGDSGGDAQDGAVNLAQKAPPIHLNQTSVLLHDGVPAAEHTYREALARCSAGAVPVQPLADDVVAKLGHTYLETWYDGERMAVKADRWDFRSAGPSAAGCVFEPVHEARLTIVEPGATTVADLVKGTATRERFDGVVREAVAGDEDGTAPDDVAQDDAKLRAQVMGELQKQGQADLVGQSAGEAKVAGQPCVRLSSSQGEACVWSGGRKWGFVTDTAADADRMDAPVDNITLSNKPADGNGYQLTTDSMSVGTPIDDKVFVLPGKLAVTPAR